MKKYIFLILVIAGVWYASRPFSENPKMVWGVTFSQKFASELGVDWQKNYLALLDDVKVRELRLIADWEIIEPKKGVFDFHDLDWQIAEAGRRGAHVILAVGRKIPRWPECHEPSWVPRDEAEKEKRILNYVRAVVEHYKNEKTIVVWQVENEPLFPFGTCPSTSMSLLNQELVLVRALDDRPIMLTDSGELGFAWPILGWKADIFGTTLYRYVQNKYFGNVHYWFIPSGYFRLKARLIGGFYGKQIVISELQAEPWVMQSLASVSLEEQHKTMDVDKFREVIDYAQQSGFPKAYLWGAEWWYWLKEKQNDASMWNDAKKMFNG